MTGWCGWTARRTSTATGTTVALPPAGPPSGSATKSATCRCRRGAFPAADDAAAPDQDAAPRGAERRPRALLCPGQAPHLSFRVAFNGVTDVSRERHVRPGTGVGLFLAEHTVRSSGYASSGDA